MWRGAIRLDSQLAVSGASACRTSPKPTQTGSRPLGFPNRCSATRFRNGEQGLRRQGLGNFGYCFLFCAFFLNDFYAATSGYFVKRRSSRNQCTGLLHSFSLNANFVTELGNPLLVVAHPFLKATLSDLSGPSCAICITSGDIVLWRSS